jgi:hypothetical protein
MMSRDRFADHVSKNLKILICGTTCTARKNTILNTLMKSRMNHQSSYEQPSIDHLLLSEQEAKVDTQQSIQDLFNRCLDCKQRIVGDIHD